MLFIAPGAQNPQALVMTVAGLLLGSVGFRELIGLTKLSSFSAGDALVVGIPLLSLTLALIRVAVRGFSHRAVPVNRVTGEPGTS